MQKFLLESELIYKNPLGRQWRGAERLRAHKDYKKVINGRDGVDVGGAPPPMVNIFQIFFKMEGGF